MAQPYLLSENISYRTLINDGVAIKFSIVGKALEMTKWSISTHPKGELTEVNVVSLLEQKGIDEAEVALQAVNFERIGVVQGDDLETLRDTLDEAKNCFFVGRITSAVNNIKYQQTFYIFRANQTSRDDLIKIIGSV